MICSGCSADDRHWLVISWGLSRTQGLTKTLFAFSHFHTECCTHKMPLTQQGWAWQILPTVYTISRHFPDELWLESYFGCSFSSRDRGQPSISCIGHLIVSPTATQFRILKSWIFLWRVFADLLVSFWSHISSAKKGLVSEYSKN